MGGPLIGGALMGGALMGGALIGGALMGGALIGGALMGGALIGGALAGMPLVGALDGDQGDGATGIPKGAAEAGGLTSTRRKMSLGPEGSEVSAPGSRRTMLSVTPGGMRIVKVR